MAELAALDAVVIGAGWAGLGVSQALEERHIRHRVLERARIAETWRSQRWDSFHLNTPNFMTVMPGDVYDGVHPDGAMTSGEFVDMLEGYVRRHRLPVDLDTPVTELSADAGVYRLTTPKAGSAYRGE